MAEGLEQQLKELIVERLFLDIAPAEIATDVELSEYGVDSFLLLELIVAMEEIFEVKFEPSDITADVLKSVATLTELIRSKQ
ncbi:acyl carrier protein [Oligosphaera ethanolica]|jgi:acyl carrier protein|uniref:Acyl carrier protein n=1 Tax=Oligosphaera ethanolica TaxID=760260 RepID=A0AAE4ALE0_9BACT|nr:acyl carrier protein [Oligosphaera ethanolica]MDQ0288174.1 acyl carrier protein [Oligosphaera ethanolica]NLE53719.1 acyl carrier protein [Lentisphaerota bacterium]HQL08032.1 acyl carrier protein [Lentisphaeria bacterium]